MNTANNLKIKWGNSEFYSDEIKCNNGYSSLRRNGPNGQLHNETIAQPLATIYETQTDATDKSDESKENPAFDFRIIEPKLDALNLSKEKVFSLVIGENLQWKLFRILY